MGRDLMQSTYRVEMADGSRWDVPLAAIARDRASHYADEFGGDIDRSLDEDTLPLFAEDPYEIEDWARGNMNWSDVMAIAKPAPPRDPPSDRELINIRQEGWVNGSVEIVYAG